MDTEKSPSPELKAASNPLLAVLPAVFVLLLGISAMVGYFQFRDLLYPSTEFRQLSGTIETSVLRKETRKSSASLLVTLQGTEFETGHLCAKKLLATEAPIDGRRAEITVATNGYSAYGAGRPPFTAYSLSIDGIALCTHEEQKAYAASWRPVMWALMLALLAGSLLCFRAWRKLSQSANETLYKKYPGLKK
jgi:hypothetical protein